MIVEVSLDLSDVEAQNRQRLQKEVMAWWSEFASEKTDFSGSNISKNWKNKQLDFQIELGKHHDIITAIQRLQSRLYPLNGTLSFRCINGEGEMENKS